MMGIARKLDLGLRRLRAQGLRWFVGALADKAFPTHLTFKTRLLKQLANGRGIEIGGPSAIFKQNGILPVYPEARNLDNVNFSTTTPWEAQLADGADFRFDAGKTSGTQWIREAVALTGIKDGAYDFVLSSHCLEHLANPLAALMEWRRVTRSGGHLVLVLPDPSRSFDHSRPITTLEHLQNDLAIGVTEDDTTHFTEALSLHDLSRDPAAGNHEEFRQRVLRNRENRCLHHHVFDLALVSSMLHCCGWRVLAQEHARPVHLVTWAQRERD
jgi:SAM-dependent methyltransferase